MNPAEIAVSYYTILRKDMVRILRIWPQTFLPSVVTSALYFLIFGAFLGSRIGAFGDIPYVSFVVPGLIMLAVVTNSFANVATVMFSAKFFSRNIDEILVSPTPPWVIVAGFVSSGVVRGVLVGILVYLTSLFFAAVSFHNVLVVIVFLILTSVALSLGGLVNGIYAKSFDGISIIPTFVLAPLVYLGGVFYSVEVLPEFWRGLTHVNPLFYIIDGFRYGFLGSSDVSPWLSFAVLLGLVAVLGAFAIHLIRTGLGLRQ
ncbi:MAG: ABC transporter permease [Bauldia sp.]|nr:ABC transporter permease [Bauldia sp.]